MEHEHILSIRSLTISFKRSGKDRLVVHDLNLDIPKGETFVLLGESGCGKSVTAYSILQLLPQSANITNSSQIMFNGQDLLGCSEYDLQSIRGTEIGIIFQDPMTSLNPVMTIGQQICEMLQARKHMSNSECKKNAIALLNEVGIAGADTRYFQYPNELSGGQKQRVVIAMALAGKPKLLIADEPTTALDVTTQAQVLQLLHKLQQKFGLSILLITHDIGVAMLMGKTTGVMYAGHLVEVNTMQNLISNPLHPYTKELMEAIPSFEKREHSLNVIGGALPEIKDGDKICRYLSRCPLKIDVCKKLEPSWFSSIGNRVRCHLYNEQFISVKSMFKKTTNPKNTPMETIGTSENVLDIKDLKVHFPIFKGIFRRVVDTIRAVNGVSFTLKKGRTLAIVAESGSGKSTTGKAIIDLVKTQAGTIRINGLRLSKFHQKFRHKIQMVFQDVYSSIDPKLTIKEIILQGLLLTERNPEVINKKLMHILKQVGLSEDMLTRYPHQFSGGQRQRIAIARSLIVSPEILILDEPTSSLDVSIQAQILNLLKDIQRQTSMSYIFISHDISVVSYMADDIAIMYLGEIVEYGPAQQILSNPKHPYTNLLLESVPDNITFDKMEINVTKGSSLSNNQGCSFASRCRNVKEQCTISSPSQVEFGRGHYASCHLYD